MNKDYKALLQKAANAAEPFHVGHAQKKAALELAASGLLIVHENRHGNIDLGLVVDGITVAGRDYLRRFWFFAGRVSFSMLLAVCSGLLGVVLARCIPDPRGAVETRRRAASVEKEDPDASAKPFFAPVPDAQQEEPGQDSGRDERCALHADGEQTGAGSKSANPRSDGSRENAGDERRGEEDGESQKLADGLAVDPVVDSVIP